MNKEGLRHSTHECPIKGTAIRSALDTFQNYTQRSRLLGCLALLMVYLCTFTRPILAERKQQTPVATDRWVEIDLYWFKQNDVAGSARRFWGRYRPLFAGIKGYRGVILNVAWTVSPVMEWSGHLDQRVSMLTGAAQSKWVDEHGPLIGTSEERQRHAAERFAKPAGIKNHPIDPWTYGDLKKLIVALKRGATQRGISDFRVGMLNLGWAEVYAGETGWISRHPEAFATSEWPTPGAAFQLKQYFNPRAHLHKDSAPLGGLPNGIPEGMTAHQAYAAQWGSLSRSVGFGAIMLRDSIGLPVPYQRGGPWGPVAPSAQIIQEATDGIAALVRETKQANPGALVMMFSNGASAIGDWRANGTDVESIAKQGYLDIFVDQTYAGAWNEVGIRQNNFWNVPTLGWTYQLGYVLGHAALLADTNVRQYTVVDTFDAWEDWDTIHTAPERLRWGIWAYSHAAVKTPWGLKFPAGSYISWVNQGERLLNANDVRFLADNLNAAAADAHQTTQVFGPTLVYAREAMQWQVDHATINHDIKEWIDEQAGSVAKWPVPILSVTRLEWLPQVQSDLFIVQTPSHLSSQHTAYLGRLIDAGMPLAIFGSPAGGIAPELSQLAGLSGTSVIGQDQMKKCHAEMETDLQDVKNIPATFDAFYRPTKNWTSQGARTIYSVEGSPVLALNTTDKKHVVVWDPPELRSTVNVPLSQTWGNEGAPYALVAGALNLLLQHGNALHVQEIDLRQTMNIAAWRTADGAFHILAGNLEEGLRDDADLSRRAVLVLPESWRQHQWKDAWTGQMVQVNVDKLPIDLHQAASVLLESRENDGNQPSKGGARK